MLDIVHSIYYNVDEVSNSATIVKKSVQWYECMGSLRSFSHQETNLLYFSQHSRCSLLASRVSLKSLHAFVIHGKCVFLMS